MFRFASDLQPDDAVEACEEAVDVLKASEGSFEVSVSLYITRSLQACLSHFTSLSGLTFHFNDQ